MTHHDRLTPDEIIDNSYADASFYDVLMMCFAAALLVCVVVFFAWLFWPAIAAVNEAAAMQGGFRWLMKVDGGL